MNDTHVEQDLGSVGNVLKVLERLVKLIVIVVAKGRHPSLDFLYRWISSKSHVQRICLTEINQSLLVSTTSCSSDCPSLPMLFESFEPERGLEPSCDYKNSCDVVLLLQIGKSAQRRRTGHYLGRLKEGPDP